MDMERKAARYNRINKQLQDLFKPVKNPLARMTTIASLLHHKFDYFFWTGFYLLEDGGLFVGPYQGSLACMQLKKDTGVCWKGINSGEAVIVANVHDFPGHIACDSRSKSEIVVPLRNKTNEIVGVLDVDSKELNSFDSTDLKCLNEIVSLVYCY